ncbi:MAG: tRNA pseudouridine(38-40) synthase TruA [Candidatus Thorarchaeota archaeon]|nr:tRNA pseudouridine(38-40) synthase TruA [Candidatus Thorarchaeota archaeon]
MVSYAARLCYLGDNYHGSQAQPGQRTVQGELIEAISRWSGEPHSTKTVQFSGRTDRGVHSMGQIVKITTDANFDIDRINRYLPDDISLWEYLRVPDQFNPRLDVIMRHYRYILGDIQDRVDLYALREGSVLLSGTHDFRLLAKPDGERNSQTTLINIAVIQTPPLVALDIFGTSFLWKLVRKLVTVLLRYSHQEISRQSIVALLESQQSLPGGIHPAPPESLVLVETVVPFRLVRSKYATRRIRKTIVARLRTIGRQSATLEAIDELLSLPTPFR